VHAPHHGGLVPHLPWAMARARAIGGTPIPGNANQPDVDIFCLVQWHVGQPHECGDAAKAWHHKTGSRLIEFFQDTILSFSF
jgi:hypothetical protein